jgi:hypothetical protein
MEIRDDQQQEEVFVNLFEVEELEARLENRWGKEPCVEIKGNGKLDCIDF